MNIFLWQETKKLKKVSNVNTRVAFKNCSIFKTRRTEKKYVFVNNPDYIYITVHMYDLIEYSDKYSDTSGSLWQFKEIK